MKVTFKTEISGGGILKTAMISHDRGEDRIYFKFPLDVQEDLTDREDPFVYALIFVFMKYGGDVHFIGKVSRSVIDNIVMFCRIWNIWAPSLCKPIRLIPEEILPDNYRPNNRRMITAFSGGLDASYTVYKYKKNLDPHYEFEVDKSVMLFGADIPLTNPDQFSRAFVSAKKMLDDIGVDIIAVETNIRDFLPSWSYAFGSVISGTLSFFSGSHFYGAASDDSVHHYATPWGMNPITDQYLTSDSFRFISDGHEHSRTDRASYVKDWKACLDNLRVCWSNVDKSKNCGYCEKCVRTKLNFFVVGQKHLPTMPSDLSFSDLTRPGLIRDPHNILYFDEIYKYGLAHGTLPKSWEELLHKQLTLWRSKGTVRQSQNIISRIFAKLKH